MYVYRLVLLKKLTSYADWVFKPLLLFFQFKKCTIPTQVRVLYIFTEIWLYGLINEYTYFVETYRLFEVVDKWTIFYMAKEKEKVKTTILLDKTIKKLTQVHAIQNDTTMQDVIEDALKRLLLKG